MPSCFVSAVGGGHTSSEAYRGVGWGRCGRPSIIMGSGYPIVHVVLKSNYEVYPNQGVAPGMHPNRGIGLGRH